MSNVTKIIELVIQAKGNAIAVFNNTTKSIESLKNSMTVSTKQTNELGKSSKKTSKDVTSLEKSTDKYSKAAAKGAKETKKFKDKLRGLGDEAGRTDDRLAKAGRGGAGSFIGLFGTLTSMALPVVEFARFERSMAEVGAVAKATEKELQDMTAVAEELGRTTEFTASQAAGGMKFLAMAGLDAASTMEAIPGVLDLALAGNVDLATAADISTNILTGMGLAVEDLSRVNDVLVEGFTSTNSTLEELGYAMSYVAPVASGMGMSLEETTTALGLLHNAGIKGSMAGTTLRGVLTRLTKPSEEAQGVMDDLAASIGQSSLEITDSEGKFLGMKHVMEQLEAAGMTTTEAMAIFGQRAGPGMVALLNQGSDAFETLNDNLDEAEGRAEEVGKAMHENLTGTFKDTLSALSGLAIAVGEKLMPAMNSLLLFITDITGTATKWVKENEELAGTLATVALAIGSVVIALQTLNIAMGISSLLGGGLFKALAAKFILLGTKVSGFFLAGMGKMVIAAGGLGAKVGTAFTTSFASALSGLGLVLAAAFAGYSIGTLIEPWINEIEVGGHKIGTHLQILFASFERFFIDVKYAFKKATEHPKAFFADVLNQFVQFGIDTNDLIKKIPGLGKVLGWQQDVTGITSSLDFVKNKVEKLQLEMSAGTASLEAEKMREVAALQNVVDMIYAEEAAIKAKQATQKAAKEAPETTSKEVKKVSTELEGSDFGKERTKLRNEFSSLMAQIQADAAAARSTADLEIAKLELKAAQGLISTQEVEARVNAIRLAGIDAETAAYSELHEKVNYYFKENSAKSQKLGQTLNALSTERIGLLIEQTSAEKALSEEVARAQEAQLQLALQQQLLDAETKGGSDLERMQSKTDAEEAYYARSIELKKNELAELRRLDGVSKADLITKENELTALQMEAQQARTDNYKTMTTERLRVAQEEFEKGIINATQYAAIVKEAWEANVITFKEFSDTTTALTGGVWENLSKGMMDAAGQAKTLGETIQDVGSTAVNTFANDFGVAVTDAIDGTKSLSESLSDMAQSFLKEIGQMIAKQLILNAVKSIGGMGLASGGQAGGHYESGTARYASGGRVRGSSPTATADNIPAWLTAGEFVQPVASVKKYGTGFMEAIRTRSLDLKGAMQGFATGGLVGAPIGMRFAEGGLVDNGPPEVNVQTGSNEFTIANVIQDSLLDDFLDSVRGEKGMINFMSKNRTVIKGTLGGA